jgi:septum formation protein
MLQCLTPRLILASGSASRRDLLIAAGLIFDVSQAGIDETAIKHDARAAGVSAETAALRLAERKAAAVARREADALVIGADQILVCEGEWFDKPGSAAAARDQLLALRGRSHLLATAVVCQQGASPVWHRVVSPRLTMRWFSEDFLDDYLAEEADTISGCVGAYRLEGRGIQLFDAVEGEHSAVLGLPLLALLGFLREVRCIKA